MHDLNLELVLAGALELEDQALHDTYMCGPLTVIMGLH